MNAELPEGFHHDSSFVFPESVYGREARKLRHALKEFERLSKDTQDWARSAKLRFVQRQSDSQPDAAEIVGRIDFLPPVEDWWFHASDAFGNLRGVLDQLNHNIFRYISGTEPGRIRFPMSANGGQWRDWRKSANAAGYPTWLIARYKRFQPYSTNRPMLRTLETITNREKHREGVSVALSLAEAGFGGWHFDVHPELPEGFDPAALQGEFPSLIDLNATEFSVVTTRIPGHAIEIEESELVADFHFQFVLRLDDEEIPLEDAVRWITHKVLWAASHVIGKEPSGTVPPSNFEFGPTAD